jgi:hypothetical protein
MQRFKSSEKAQDLSLPTLSSTVTFTPPIRLVADTYRAIRSETFTSWHCETCAQYG